MKICILGSTGMLGVALRKHFENSKHEIWNSFRNKEHIENLKGNYIHLDVSSQIEQQIKTVVDSDFDYIINCIGIIKPYINKDPIVSININSIFPRLLANKIEESCKKVKLIHITTDCVYSGATGKYKETSPHDCLDFYGKTKSLGEPENCMTIRTSIIGEELHGGVSLVAWAKSQAGKEVNGFTNHFWNGVTTNQYAKVCEKIINENLYRKGLYHVFSKDVNKYEMLNMIDDRYSLSLKINKHQDKQTVDRTLRTEKELNEIISVPSLDSQIKEML